MFAMGVRVGEVKFPDITDTLATTTPTKNPLAVKITTSATAPKKRMPVFRQLPYGAVKDYAPLCVDPDHQLTQIRGIEKRLGAKVGTDDKKVYESLSKFVDNILTRVPVLSSIMTTQEWLDSTSYNEARKNELLREVEILEKRGIPGIRKLATVTPFVKRESYPQVKHARWINAPNDKFKCVSGPAFKSMEQIIYDCDLFGLGHTPFIKHTPVTERPLLLKALSAKAVKFLGTDFTAFESHMTVDVMRAIETRIYRHMLGKFPEVSERICKVLEGRRTGRTRAGVSFSVNARRMSGDCCTSLGNGLTNAVLWAFICSEKNTTWDGYVEGDDGIFAVIDGVAPTAADYKKLGFTIKIESSSDVADLSFCGLVMADGAVLRDPRKFLQNFGWTGSFLFSKKSIMLGLLKAKALSAINETPSCPIVHAIARRALALTEGVDPRFVVDGYHTGKPLSVPEAHITIAIRNKFASLYGVSASTQIALETHILAGGSLDLLSETLPPNSEIFDYARKYIERG